MTIFISLIFLSIIAILSLYFYMQKKFSSEREKYVANINGMTAENLVLNSKIKNFTDDLEEKKQKLDILEQDNNSLQNFKGRYEQTQVEIAALRAEMEKNLNQISFLNQQILEFEKEKSLIKQKLQQVEQEKLEWAKTKENILLQLSEELIKKNHEQQSKLTAESQESIKQTTENLFKTFENVVARVNNLDDDVKKSCELVNQTRGALLTPKAAGDISEITLENILKASGLKRKESLNSVGDYILQSQFFSTEREGKRPDAILFLPDNNIIIIDSKSSSHFIELFEARRSKNEADEKTILAKLKESMRKHSEGLKKRDYAKFFEDEMRLQNFDDCKILIAMFLQTEQMFEIIYEIDQSFFQKNLENGLVIMSPIGLVNLLNQSKSVIDSVRRQENIAELKTEIVKLIDNIALTINDSRDLGKALNKGLETCNKINKRFNRGIISGIKNLNALGFSSKKSDEIKLLENYDLEEEF